MSLQNQFITVSTAFNMMRTFLQSINKAAGCLFILLFIHPACTQAAPVVKQPEIYYTVSMPNPASHLYHVELSCSGLNKDSVVFKMPQWMPGYYQIMNYGNNLQHFSVQNHLTFRQVNNHTWTVYAGNNTAVQLSYDILAEKQFVANSFLDTTHGYIIPGSVFLYPDQHLRVPVTVKLNSFSGWKDIATGLTPVYGKPGVYAAPDFDILYDCPILMGNLEALPVFFVKGIPHHFIGYKMGNFDRQQFISNVKKVVEAASNIIGDIPYREYTFIAIGPGRGGIEHLNNCTVSFDGKDVNTPQGMGRVMNFLAHEYFHHYNVKRIRPLELGPFDYEKGSRTNLLWVSEGLSVYYEYMAVKRAGLIDDDALFKNFEYSMGAFENSPGRTVQSLVQSGYQTWSEGPFGKQDGEAAKTISYYDKGPVVGLLLDFNIRNATTNNASLDDVMRFLYHHYYQQLGRGFTDAEFQQACEEIAGIPLTAVFEYVYTPKELDYTTYLAYAGLKVDITVLGENGKRQFKIAPLKNPTTLQKAIAESWLKTTVN